MKPYIVAFSAALLITAGMPIWANYCVDLAIAAARSGIIREQFAPTLGGSLYFLPPAVMVALILAAVYRRAVA